MIFIPLRPYDGFPLLNRAPDIHVLPRGILSDNTGLSYIASFFFFILPSFFLLSPTRLFVKVYSFSHRFIQIHSTAQAMCW